MASEARSDYSSISLIASNLLALLVAHATGMSLRDLMLVYWMQSVIIGIASATRIACVGRFDGSGFRFGGRGLQDTRADKLKVAAFFVFHFGAFHAFYLFILLHDRDDTGTTLPVFLACALVFAVNHGYSLLQNLRRDASGRPKIGMLVVLPYARIVPMHLTILAGGAFFDHVLFGGGFAFFLFGATKTAADVLMHTVENRMLAAS